MRNEPLMPGETGPRLRLVYLVEALGWSFAFAVVSLGHAPWHTLFGTVMTNTLMFYLFNLLIYRSGPSVFLLKKPVATYSEQLMIVLRGGMIRGALFTLAFNAFNFVYWSIAS